jgi:hypothetical protein
MGSKLKMFGARSYPLSLILGRSEEALPLKTNGRNKQMGPRCHEACLLGEDLFYEDYVEQVLEEEISPIDRRWNGIENNT